MGPVFICLKFEDFKVSLSLSAKNVSTDVHKDFDNGFRGAIFSLVFVPRNVNPSRQTGCCKGCPLKTVTKEKCLSIRTLAVKSQKLTTLKILPTPTQTI